MFEINFPSDPDVLYNAVYGGQILPKMDQMGLDLYNPFEVAGYPAYHQAPGYHRNWITSNTLGYRYEFIQKLLDGSFDVQIDALDFVDRYVSAPGDAGVLVDELIDLLFPLPIPQERRDYFHDIVLLETLAPLNWQLDWTHYKAGGDDVAVRRQLHKLIRELIQTAEFQLS